MAGVAWLIYHLVKDCGVTPKNTWLALIDVESGCLGLLVVFAVPLIFAVIAGSTKNFVVKIIFLVLEAVWWFGLLVYLIVVWTEDRRKKQDSKQEDEEEE